MWPRGKRKDYMVIERRVAFKDASGSRDYLPTPSIPCSLIPRRLLVLDLIVAIKAAFLPSSLPFVTEYEITKKTASVRGSLITCPIRPAGTNDR